MRGALPCPDVYKRQVVLMVATLLVIRAIVATKHAGIFQEMAEADKALAK